MFFVAFNVKYNSGSRSGAVYNNSLVLFSYGRRKSLR